MRSEKSEQCIQLVIKGLRRPGQHESPRVKRFNFRRSASMDRVCRVLESSDYLLPVVLRDNANREFGDSAIWRSFSAFQEVQVVEDKSAADKTHVYVNEPLAACNNRDQTVQFEILDNEGGGYTDRHANSLGIDGHFTTCFHRTVRMPDDNRLHHLPSSLGTFPLHNIVDYADRLPDHMLEKGGVFLPMWQREALWMSFHTTETSVYAIRIYIGHINAVTGQNMMDRSSNTDKEQDYVVVPGQHWVDGVCISPGVVRQFVAMPLGSGYTVEGQKTGEEKHGGLQIEVIPAYRQGLTKWLRAAREENFTTLKDDIPFLDDSKTPASLGLKPGDRLRSYPPDSISERPMVLADLKITRRDGEPDTIYVKALYDDGDPEESSTDQEEWISDVSSTWEPSPSLSKVGGSESPSRDMTKRPNPFKRTRSGKLPPSPQKRSSYTTFAGQSTSPSIQRSRDPPQRAPYAKSKTIQRDMQGIGSWVGKSHSLVRKDKNGRRSRSRTRSKPHGHALSAARSEPDKTRSASQRRKHMAAVAGLVELHSGSRVASPSKIYPDPARSSTALIENGNDAVTGRIPAEHYYGQLSSLGGAYYMDDTEYDLQVCEQAEKEEGCSADGVHRNPYGERNDPKPYPPSPQAAGKSPHFLQQFRSAGLVQPQKPGPASPNRPVTSILSSTHSQRLGNAVLHSESPFGPPSQESSYYTTSSAPISAQMPPQSSALSNSSILKMDSSQQPTPPQPAMLNPPLPGIGNPGMQNKNAYQSPPLEASSSVVTRPSLATVPRVERQESNGVQWIAFEYSRDRIKMEYTIRCDVESVNVDNLSQEFKTKNCVYPRACCSKDQYRGNRLVYETECNAGGWALAELNPALRGKRGLIQRAVDSWRNSNQDPRLRSRLVRRQAKTSGRGPPPWRDRNEKLFTSTSSESDLEKEPVPVSWEERTQEKGLLHRRRNNSIYLDEEMPVRGAPHRAPRRADWRGEGREQMKNEPDNVKAMGLAAGGKLVQDIYRDPHHPSIWNVAAARMINVHILDPTSCEEVTHIVPPPIPMDAYEYVEKRLPFFVVNEQIDDRLNGGRFDDIKSVSQMDENKGANSQPQFDPSQPTICRTCESRLCDCIVRPCNHQFCNVCIRQLEDSKDSFASSCPQCSRRVSRVVGFSAPMNIPGEESVRTKMPVRVLQVNDGRVKFESVRRLGV